MKKNKILFVLWALCFFVIQTNAQTPLSFEESLHLLNQGNQSLKIADKGIEIAKAERDKLNAFWYPTLQSTGAFVHMSEKIEVKQPLSQFTDPAKDFVHSIIPDDQIISAVLDKIGANTLVFPLTPRNLTTVDLSAEWVLFSAKWVYGIAVINESGKESTYTWTKEGIYLVDKVCKKISTGYPLDSITKNTKNNKYLVEITEEEKEAMKQDEQDVVDFIAENI